MAATHWILSFVLTAVFTVDAQLQPKSIVAKVGCPFQFECRRPCLQCVNGQCVPICPKCHHCKSAQNGKTPICIPDVCCPLCQHCAVIKGISRCVPNRCPLCYHCEVVNFKPTCVKNFPFVFDPSLSSGIQKAPCFEVSSAIQLAPRTEE